MSTSEMGIGEFVALRKRGRHEVDIYLYSRLRVLKYRKGDTEPYEITDEVHNTLDNGGKAIFLELICGLNANHYDESNALLDVGGPALLSMHSITSGTPAHASPSSAYVWNFWDDTANAYTPANVRLWNLDPLDLSAVRFNDIDVSGYGWGSKTASENWHYQLTIEIYSLTSAFTDAGFDELLLLFMGTSTNHITAATTRMQPYSDNPPTVAVGSAITAASLACDTSGYRLVFEFDSAAGSNTGDWVATKIYHSVSSKIWRSYGCKADNSSCGTKGAGDDWTYIWYLNVVQG